MTDLLDVRDERPRPPGRRRRRGLLPKLLGVSFVLLLLVGLVGGGVYAARGLFSSSAPEDYPGPGTGEVVIQIEPGETAGNVADKLSAEDVVASRAAFFQVAASDERSRGLQPGFYRLRQQMSAAGALDLLLDPASRLVGRVTVPEGFTVEQTLERIAENSEIPLDELEAAAQDVEALGLPDYANGELEGFLFPATYELEPGTTAPQVLRMMVARYERAVTNLDLEANAAAIGRTPYEVLIVASLIEREVRFDDEYPRVAQVVYNRLEQGERVDIDAAVLYGLGRTSGGLTRSDLDSDSPYNLRKFRGLPPTPISSPGEATLRGALNPSGGDELFYVLFTTEGRSEFTETLAEHNRAVADARARGIF